jgi:Zn finger protein HypA/HybF involved in hydrogenase expression
MQAITYQGGIAIVERQDKPELQCDDCHKPSWFDQYVSLLIACEHCNGHLSLVTEDEPFRHK